MTPTSERERLKAALISSLSLSSEVAEGVLQVMAEAQPLTIRNTSRAPTDELTDKSTDEPSSLISDSLAETLWRASEGEGEGSDTLAETLWRAPRGGGQADDSDTLAETLWRAPRDGGQADDSDTLAETLWRASEGEAEGASEGALEGDDSDTLAETLWRASEEVREGQATAQADLEAQRGAVQTRLSSEPPGLRESLAPLPKLSQARYQRVMRLGQGGMGEVWRVYDHTLKRHLALKQIRAPLAQEPSLRALFVREARLAARLQHPSIIPIHDLGVDDEGLVCFVMDEVSGEPFSERIQALHQASSEARWAEGDSLSLRRLVDQLSRAADAVAYAHTLDVTHRDLKPENLLLGAHGEVWVIDWGLAGVKGVNDEQLGGTPLYMPPEQARQRPVALLTAPTIDVFSLGATLYELLAGASPYQGSNLSEVMSKLTRGELPQLSAEVRHKRPLPVELVELCQEAMSHEPSHRPRDASVFSARLKAWLDGAQRRAKAQALVSEAQTLMSEALSLSERSAALRREAERGLKALPKSASPEHKATFWRFQERAERDEVSAARLEADRHAALLAALSEDPINLDARHALAATTLVAHRRAERARALPQAAALADELTRHIERLPSDDVSRTTVAHYLRGVSRFQLTLPTRARVALERFEPTQRRLVAQRLKVFEGVERLDLELPIGSYQLVINAEGFEEVRYPFLLERGTSWDERGPSGREVPLPLPRLGELKPWERYVPRGWFYAGGDPEAPFGLPERPVWVEGVVISALQVTHAEYLAFVNDLHERGLEDELRRFSPHEQRANALLEHKPIYTLREGRFEHPEGEARHAHPVTQITWEGARAFCAWLSRREGLAQEEMGYRLPLELEWEKAARGVDRRRFPWGDQFDASYCVMMDSHSDQAVMSPAHNHPYDQSPYGVMSCAGNCREWCLDLFNPDGYQLDELGLSARLPTAEELASPEFRASRGGSYGNAASRTRAADRDWWFPELSYLGRGMRVARPYPLPEAH